VSVILRSETNAKRSFLGGLRVWLDNCTNNHRRSYVRGSPMNVPLGNSIRQELLSRRNKIASILENLQFQEVELRVRIVGHEEKLELNRLCMLDSLDAWYHRELIEVDNALMRIDTGEFGLCLGCGSQIDAHWIEVFPEGEFCRNCDQMKKWMALD